MENKMICLIGNSGTKHNDLGGQTTKVRLYMQKIKDEGFDLTFVELENFTRRPFSTLIKIKKAIKQCDRIVLISASRGCKYLIPYINWVNKKYKKVFVLPLIGTSVLHHAIDGLDDNDKNEFLLNGKYDLVKKSNKRTSKQLSKINCILPETDLLTKVFSEYYGLNNVITLTNFRDNVLLDAFSQNNGIVRLVYLSRVMKEKGAFDLLQTVKRINDSGKKIVLDVYGKIEMNDEQRKQFNCFLDGKSIVYKGPVKNEEAIKVINAYDLFVFPTRFVGEGTPGVIVESLMAGTPVLTSDFPQAHLLMKDGYDSVFFKMFDNEDLYNKLISIIDNKEQLLSIRKNAFESGKKYTYKFNRDLFLKYICGVNDTKII